MDTLKVRSLVEQFRPLSEMSSLPFWVSGRGNLFLCWFNYDLDESPEVLKASVNSLYTLEEGAAPVRHTWTLTKDLPLTTYTDPTVSVPEYYARLEKLQSSFTADAMAHLIAMAEPQPLPQLYEIAAQAAIQMKGV